MQPVTQHYDWGSVDAIPNLAGTRPDGRPQAELWFGAHPSGPSMALVDGVAVPLGELIGRDPAAMLGAASLARFGPELPFLVKVLAAARPLSLQAHPSGAQAAAGFDAEDTAGVARDAPERTYRDRNAKPELLCALGSFDALAGFRPPAEAAAVLDAFGVPPTWTEPLAAGNLSHIVGALWDLGPDARGAMVATVVHHGPAAAQRYPREAALVARLAELHAGDIGIVVALLLNRVRLGPGQALGSPAGRLHSYLDGVGVEVMANSDNVVRGGLTSKSVNLAELRRVVNLVAETVEPIGAEAPTSALVGAAEADPVEEVFPFPAEEFRLSRLTLDGGLVELEAAGPEILICVDGGADLAAASVPAVGLARLGGAFVPATTGRYGLRGVGTVFRATIGSIGGTGSTGADTSP